MQAGPTRPYQGYPYVNPMVTDAPSLSPEAARQWANLPRRPIANGWRQPGSGTTVKEPSCSQLTQMRAGSRTSLTVEEARATRPSKRDPDVTPAVYIDLPESSGSDVVQSREMEEDTESSFVQDTIMFDQFENRRIDFAKRSEADTGSERSCMSESSTGLQSTPGPSNAGPFTIYRYPEPQIHQGRQTPPNTLEMNTFATPRTPMTKKSSTSQRTPGLPDFLQNETCVYGGGASDGSAASNAGTEFPEPPPAYTEIDTLGRPTNLNHEQRPPGVAVELPRTQVITSLDSVTPMGLPNYHRKYLMCHHCGQRVHSLVIRQNGTTTHVIACILFLIFMPLVLLAYCTDLFKHKNHYCPNCNKLIGYVIPIIGTKLYFVN